MSFPFFKSLFTKESKSLKLPDSILIKQIKSIADSNELILFNNIAIYHHAKKYIIPLLLLDKKRGLYIFEKKEWTYDELKNATIEQAQYQETSTNTLSYQNIQSLINQKLNELTHKDGVPIYNYLLMENLNASQYKHLDDSFKKLLPENRIVFSDSTKEDIVKKLEKVQLSPTPLASSNHILGNLLIQYSILDKDLQPHLASKEQIAFLDSEFDGIHKLQAVQQSGKSSVLLLKSITQKLNNSDEKIIILKPTVLAVDLLKKRLLEIIEHAIVEIDFSTIEIVTPLELVNRHLSSLKMDLLKEDLHIADVLMLKKFHHSETIFCDDADLFDSSFTNYLKHIQEGKKLLLVNIPSEDADFQFKRSFISINTTIKFHQANQHAKTLQLVLNLLKTEKSLSILCEKQTQEKLLDDMTTYIKQKAHLIDSTQSLMNQKLDALVLTGYDDINEVNIQNLILLDICTTSQDKIEYALKRAQKSVHIIYEKECQISQELKEKYENS